eukprot:3766035-Prymnesium_polylepis.1
MGSPASLSITSDWPMQHASIQTRGSRPCIASKRAAHWLSAAHLSEVESCQEWLTKAATVRGTRRSVGLDGKAREWRALERGVSAEGSCGRGSPSHSPSATMRESDRTEVLLAVHKCLLSALAADERADARRGGFGHGHRGER